ncbi:PepSY domain-containing protein [Arthrobacter sp. NEB 688]|uniref:PepSY-associated TM helix domain-containing protein n=1 Tax=Arthrobacter sp. NEB 688 TaxID=904039 RepID=UPI0015663787|nr:PepSY domain-containing protein [Arthrobacter sp. NEB 688]QKE86178.1 PepSY domain-containing protein [Arthrobacter sp. NEB 688]
MLKDPTPDTAPEPSRPAPSPARDRRGTGLFRAFWRWHFYASVVVIPTVFVLAVTGLVYLFRFQIEPVVHADLLRVSAPAGATPVTYEEQLEAVRRARPADTVVSMTEPAAPDQSTRFTVTTPDEATRDVFVDPYSGSVLGSLDPDTTISGTAVRLHADLMAGPVGDLFLELGACWAIVMAVTGYYLFFRGRRARLRLRRKDPAAARLRSTHAWTGFFVGAGLLTLVVSGLPWTGVWGAQAQKLAAATGTSFWGEDHGALSDPTSTLDESLPHSHGVIPWAQEKSSVPRSTGDPARSVANVDTAVTVGEQRGLAHPMTVVLPSDDTGVYSAIGYAFDDPGAERTVHVDRYGGTAVSEYGYDDYSPLAKTVSHGIALHEGRHFGVVNMTLTTLFCLAVIASCVTGPAMWWRRRPARSGSLGAPRGRMPVATSPVLAVVLVLLCVVLPVFGASVVVVLVAERLLRRSARARRVLALTP